MFCHKCGNQAEQGAAFCNKCGERLITLGAMTAQSAVDSVHIITPAPQQQPVYQQQPAYQQPIADTGFREFVDNHVSTTTKFKSAQDLITNSKPSFYILICFAGAALAFLLLGLSNGGLTSMGLPGFIVIVGFFGYVAMFIVGAIIRLRYRRRFNGEFNGDISIEDLLVFLNEHLIYIHPDFHNWDYLSSKGGVLTGIENSAAIAAKEVRICTTYGPKEKRLAVLTIRQNPDDPTAIRKYFVDASKNGFNLDARSDGMFGHSTLIKTAPILQAAMEYYIKTRT